MTFAASSECIVGRGCEADRLSAQASGRTTRAPCAPVSCELQLSGRELEQAEQGDCKGRVACRRTLSARRLHRDDHEPPARARRCFLQQRGTCEQWIKEGKGAIKWTRLRYRETFDVMHCHAFKSNRQK